MKKKGRKVWDFDEWFRLQHGPCPGRHVSDEEMEEKIERGQFFMALKAQRTLWLEKRTSALYAWQIPDSSKPISQRWHTTRRAKR